MLATGAELGIAFDGDADRIGAVDEHGTVIWGDYLLFIYAREILTRKPGATFIGEVKCSQVLYDELTKLGGNAIMYKTGHSLIKAKMKEEHAELAGEMSGHIFFADGYYGFDDAPYAACRLIDIVAKSGTSALGPDRRTAPARLHAGDPLRYRRRDQIRSGVARSGTLPKNTQGRTTSMEPASFSLKAGASSAPPTRSPCW